MAKKYTYSRAIFTPNGESEQFSAVEFDSFDEARKVVDKAIHERRLEIKATAPRGGVLMGLDATKLNPPSTPTGSTLGPVSGDNGGNANTTANPTGDVSNTPAGN